ncbi:MAG: aminopeptidase [Proteobacteria bacterium]|nr:aminopeptidase [Pseudomonadota bacterium]MCP4921955.1 aminopeptidase [Pseudomonadota bacterium]
MQRRRLAATGLVLGTLGVLLMPGCKVGYLLKSGYYQAELLALREPVDDVRQSGRLDDEQLGKLDLIADVKAYGREIGLSATDNYETISIDWERQIWNVSACDPTAFEPKTWWFPIVGTFPYLGYFKEEDARDLERKLADDGYDVYVRTAGAYSTLGWFKDPILPKMLGWDDFALADTVLHELAHATLWVPGSVKFNESYANFVGEVAAVRYLADRRGVHDETLLKAVNRQADRAVYRALLHGLYTDLDQMYEDNGLDDGAKLEEKERLFTDELLSRVRAADFHDRPRYEKAVTTGTWNNARMVQFKTYNTNEQLFAAVLEEVDGDLLAFIGRIDEITRDADDPFIALEGHVGAR